MKAAIYTRVSTDAQAEVEFNSCETQELKIRSFIASQNNIEVYKVYSDQGYTGANTDRPALKDLLHDIQDGKIDTVIAYKIDRLTRSPKDFYQLIEIFEKYNASFLSITERFDTSTPSGRLLRNIMLTFGQFERELISERIRDKMLERAKKGMWNRGPAPFGYKKEEKKLAIEPKESKTVRAIFEEYVASPRLGDIYRKLKGEEMFNRAGLPIAKPALRHILQSVVYAGLIKHKGVIYQGIHEPIVTKALFDEAQKIKLDAVRPKVSMSYNYLLFPGLVQCKECGSIMTSAFASKHRAGKRTRYFYYRCSVIDKRDRSFCNIRQVSATRLDKFIVENLDKMRKNKQHLDSLVYMLNNDAYPTPKGLEPRGSHSPIEVERLQEILGEIVDASKLKGKTDKRLIVKGRIEKVVYSKETIEVRVLYSESGESSSVDNTADSTAFARLRRPSAELCPSLAKDEAACRQSLAKLGTPPSRPSSAMVRCDSIMARPSFCRTIPLIIPCSPPCQRAPTLFPHSYNGARFRIALILQKDYHSKKSTGAI